MLFIPSVAVNDLWHELILENEDYSSFCNEAFGSLLLPPSKKDKSFNIQMAKFLMWEKSCQEEGLYPLSTYKLPLIYKIDKLLKIKNGLYYSVEKERTKYQKYYAILEAERRDSCGSCGS